MIWAALGIVLCELIIVVMVGIFTRTFSKYTEAVLRAHEASMAAQQRTLVTQQQFVRAVDYIEELLRKENAA